MTLKLKRFTQCFCLLFCLAVAHNATAQFWRAERKTRKVNSLNKYPLKPIKQVEQEKQKIADKPKKNKQFEYPASVKKERYRIDVLIPLYLDELVNADGKASFAYRLPDKAQAGFSFYEGIQLAVDTLTNMGYQTDVIIHDVASKGQSVEDLLAKDSLKKSDLLIGFVSSQQVEPLAKFAAKQHINFVSAFSPSDAGIEDNPYFILMNPTLQNNCETIVEAIGKKRKTEPMLLLKRETSSVDSAAYHFMIDDGELADYQTLDCTQMPDSAKLAKHIDTNRINYVLMPIMDAGYADKIIDALHQYFPSARFEIYGMPSWKGICNNKKMIDYGVGTSIYLTQPYNFEQSNTQMNALNERYKNKFLGRPNELNYRGYELLCWLTDLLNKYGAVFNEKTSDNGMAFFNQYKIQAKKDKDRLYYLENKRLYLYHYQGGTLTVQ